jgi:hypothetical protein
MNQLEKQMHLQLICVEPLTFKIIAEKDDHHNYQRDLDSIPATLGLNMRLVLVSGKWPLGDYTDNGKETFIFRTLSGSCFSVLLTGFTHDCSDDIIVQDHHIRVGNFPGIRVGRYANAFRYIRLGNNFHGKIGALKFEKGSFYFHADGHPLEVHPNEVEPAAVQHDKMACLQCNGTVH